MSVKLKSLFLLSMIIFLLSGCQEVENEQYLDEVNNIEIEEDVDFSDIYAPDEVYIYSAKFWEQEDEVIIDTFLDGKYDKTEKGGLGKSYFSAPDTKNEKVLVIMDEGMDWYGRREHLNMKGGFNFGYYNSFYKEGNVECGELEVEYCNRKQMSGNKPDDKDNIFINAKETVTDKLSKIGMKGYDIDASAVFNTDNKKKGILIYWKQFIDNIPLSAIGLSKINIANTKVYNSKIYDGKLNWLDSTLCTEFIENFLVRWSNLQCIDEWRKIKKYPVIPVSKAYQRVKEQFKNGYSGDAAPVLEMTQLQYQTAEINDKIYLYPVWVFCIRTEEVFKIETETNKKPIWNYYLIDAVSGEYFTDIDTEELEK